VTIVFTDANGDPVGDPITVTPGADGSFETSFTVPVGTVGPLRATVTQGDSEATTTVEVRAAGVLPDVQEPELDLPDGPVAPGDTVPIKGTEWDPTTPVTIVITDGDGQQIGGAVIITPNADGSFEYPFVVPPGTKGPLTVTVTQGSSEVSGTVDVVATEPIAGVRYPEIVRGTGAEQVVSGSGFEPGEQVRVQDVAADVDETLAASADGTFSLTVPVTDEFELGATRFEVSGGAAGELAGDQETTDFTVVASNEANGYVQIPRIVRGTGVVQTVIGQSFYPGETVTATVYSVPFDLPAQIADSNGVVMFTFPIDAEFELGRHSVELSGTASGDIPSSREDTRFTVVDAADLPGISGPAGTGNGNSGPLAYTGFDGMWLGGLAVLLVLAGGAIVYTNRKRTSHHSE
jgi:hypothetical protein